MRLFHLLTHHWGQAFSGVPRFGLMLRINVFPQILEVTPETLPAWADGDVCITDNHLSLLVPDFVRTLVVHHGCAPTHYERDPGWRSEKTSQMCADQLRMFGRPNRVFVSPSTWVLQQFLRHAGPQTWASVILPHAVGPGAEEKSIAIHKTRPVVLGDWRDHNKGAGVWQTLAARLPIYEFRRLDCPPGKQWEHYETADLYLCLSLSEGAPYAVADAEARGLPIVTTDVGCAEEFEDNVVVPWQERGGRAMEAAIFTKMRAGRTAPSYFAKWTVQRWAEHWKELVGGHWPTNIHADG